MKKLTSILLLLLLCTTAYSQSESLPEGGAKEKSEEVKIYFDHDSHAINLDLRQNRESLLRFTNLFDKINSDTLLTISKIEVNSYASPEGGRVYNEKLTKNRSESIYNYLITKLEVPQALIEKKHSGTNWDKLQELVEGSDMEYKDEVLYILKNVPEETWRRVNPTDRWQTMVDSRNKHLMELRWGNPYRYMFANIYPELRNGSVVTIYFEEELPAAKEEEPTQGTGSQQGVGAATGDEVEQEEEVQEVEQEPEPIIEVAAEETTKPLFAIKTNLLYDAVTALNVELEVPIGQRWSIAAEWVFPWWTSGDEESSNRNCFQLLNGNIEAKYWFGDRTNRPVMTGWHLGLYAGGGLYDFEYDKEGYQGEFFIAAGLSGGYAHTINKSGSLRMEYSLAVGYLKTSYDKYAEHWGIDQSWHTIRQESGNYIWFGPTRAKVSLVWMLNRKVNKEK